MRQDALDYREARRPLGGRRKGACGLTRPTLGIRPSDHLRASVAAPLAFIRQLLAGVAGHCTLILLLDILVFSETVRFHLFLPTCRYFMFHAVKHFYVCGQR